MIPKPARSSARPPRLARIIALHVLAPLALAPGCRGGDGLGFATDGEAAAHGDDDATPSLGPTTGTHLLVANDDWLGTVPDYPVVEFRLDTGEVQWSLEFEEGYGAEGVERTVNGDTYATRKGLAPPHVSYVDRYGPDGTREWTWDGPEGSGLRFIHDLVLTAAGDLIVADTDHSRVLSVDPGGQLLWSLSGFSSEGVAGASPNGLDYARGPGTGDERMLVTLRSSVGTEIADSLREYRLVARDAPPELLWQYPAIPDGSLLAIAHGPRFASDGIRTVCSSLDSRILGLDGTGQLVWSLPPEGREGDVDGPRDARFTAAGQLIVGNSDSGEIIVVDDPFGAWEVVQRLPSPGVYGFDILDCSDSGGPPCFGPP